MVSCRCHAPALLENQSLARAKGPGQVLASPARPHCCRPPCRHGTVRDADIAHHTHHLRRASLTGGDPDRGDDSDEPGPRAWYTASRAHDAVADRGTPEPG